MGRRARYTKIALQTLYNEPGIVEGLDVREDSLSSRRRVAEDGDVGLTVSEAGWGCRPVHSCRAARVHRAGGRNSRTDVA